jgi:7-cyano-7-deazaguanine synthase
MRRKAVVLLSGGVDSSTTLAIARIEGFDVYALSFDYGQRNDIELKSAEEVAKANRVKEHRVFSIDLRTIGGSALTGDFEVPVESKVESQKSKVESSKFRKVPITYVPARNTIFLAIALAWAEVLGAEDIFIGVNAMDYSGYPDCRPEYVEAFEKLAGLATVSGKVRIRAPLMHMTKAEIVARGISLGIDYSMTQSCYNPAPDGAACGKCESCRLRIRGFEEAGIEDSISYQ